MNPSAALPAEPGLASARLNRMFTGARLIFFASMSAFAQSYFPAGALPVDAGARYERFLKALHEPSLSDLASRDPSAEAYRLLWLRADDRPASVRLQVKPSGTGWFYRRMTGGNGSTQPTGLRESGMSWSWKSRTASFLKVVDDSGFWNLPNTQPLADAACRSHWILEGVRQGKYRVIDRCSPTEDDPIRVVGAKAIRLGNLKVYGRKVY